MTNQDIITISQRWLQTDWESKSMSQAERKSEYHKALYLSHLLTDVKRRLVKQTQILRRLGMKEVESK